MTVTTTQPATNGPADLTHAWEGLVPLADVLAHVHPAYGDTWDGARAMLDGGCPCESETVQRLIGDLTTSGAFREPVRIYVPDGTDPEDTLSIGNGMHRTIATWLAGHTHINVTSRAGKDEDVARIVFTLAPIEGRTQVGGCGCDDDDFWPSKAEAFGFSWLRSVRVDADTWAESDHMGQRNGAFTGHYYVPEDRISALLEVLTTTAENGGWLFESRDVRYADWDTHFDAEEAEDEAELAARKASAEQTA